MNHRLSTVEINEVVEAMTQKTLETYLVEHPSVAARMVHQGQQEITTPKVRWWKILAFRKLGHNPNSARKRAAEANLASAATRA